jgi:hypothetical protein
MAGNQARNRALPLGWDVSAPAGRSDCRKQHEHGGFLQHYIELEPLISLDIDTCIQVNKRL